MQVATKDQRLMEGSTTKPTLSFRGVNLTFSDGTDALRDINLDISQNEFVSIVGPSGCGKSTLLRVASGLEDASSGALETDHDHLGYVFQDATLLPWRTVSGNVGLLAELRKLPKPEREKKVADALELVGLDKFANYHPRRLSGGMRMRVSLARALTMDPQVFLFDEPFGALDEITRERLNDELTQLFVTRQFAALFVTHSIFEAVYLSTRVVVMSPRPGRIIAEFKIPFAYPRQPEIRFTPQFAEIAGNISEALRKELD